MIVRIALRNVLRNARRSAATIGAVVLGACALLLFGGFAQQVVLGFETSTVQRTGHLSIFKRGYIDHGTGNPAGWGFDGWRELADTLRADPELGPRIRVLTPAVALLGLANNPGRPATQAVAGLGVVPSDRSRFRLWDEHGLMDEGWRRRVAEPTGLSDEDPDVGIVGVGLARLLGLCAQLPDCATREGMAAETGAAPPGLNVLAATTGGPPNIAGLRVARAIAQGQKEVDEGFVAMNLGAAQRLLFGAGSDRVTSLVIQLHHGADLEPARRRLDALLAARGGQLESRSFAELTPFYGQALGMFRAVFGFIAAILATIVFFVVVNAMNANVAERTPEIGTTRAIGTRRSGIARLFLAEGGLLGVAGASAGVLLAFAGALLVNHAGLSWTPPGQSGPVPLRVLLEGAWTLVASVWLGLVMLSTLAALLPALRASGLRIVDALRAA